MVSVLTAPQAADWPSAKARKASAIFFIKETPW
jgi:hypothetical protein